MTGIDPALARAVVSRSTDGKLPCHAAEEIAQELSVAIETVGQAINSAGIRITACQLGLFGAAKKKMSPHPVDPKVAELLEQRSVNNSLECAQAWAIAEEFSMPRLSLGAACNALGIQITKCQLGAF